MKKLRIGVIGCANIAEKYVIPAIKESKEYELIAIASRTNEEKLKFFSNKFNCLGIEGYDNLLKRKDIDCVYLPLPPSLHKEWTLKAIENGKHVIVEKPFDISYNSTIETIKKAKSNNIILMENYMFSYHSQIDYLKNFLLEEVGSIRNVRASFGFPLIDKSNFRYKKNMGGGVLLDAAGYPVKACQILFDENLKVLSSNLNFIEGFEVDMYGSATLITEKNITCQISFGFDNYYQCNLEIWGKNGKIIMERIFTAPPGFKPKVILEKQDKKTEIILSSDNHFLKILKKFHHFINFNKDYNEYEKIINQARLIDEIRRKSQNE